MTKQRVTDSSDISSSLEFTRSYIRKDLNPRKKTTKINKTEHKKDSQNHPNPIRFLKTTNSLNSIKFKNGNNYGVYLL